MLHPLFVTVVALGLVLATMLTNIYSLRDSTLLAQRTLVTDVALTLDSLGALPRDANLNIEYHLPYNFTIDAKREESIVRVYSEKPKDGETFIYTEDPQYRYQFTKLTGPATITLYKNGNTIGMTDKNIIFKRYCEPLDFRITLAKADLPQGNTALGTTYSTLAAVHVPEPSDATIILVPKQEASSLKAYVNNDKAARIACHLLNNILSKVPYQQHGIIPVNPALLPPDHPRKALATEQPTILIEASHA